MKILAYLMSVLACFALFTVMMRVKGDVSLLLRERQQLAHEQRQLQEDVRVLRAEFAHLSYLPSLTKAAKRRHFKEVVMTQLSGTLPW